MVDTQAGRHNAAVQGWSVLMGTKYTEEFKQEAVRLIEEGASVRRVAADLDVSEWTIRGWLKKARGAESRPKGKPSVEEENRQLRAEVRRLKLEQEILKKATAFFASHQR